jgi:formate dehydrogenase assembly factor FdhD
VTRLSSDFVHEIPRRQRASRNPARPRTTRCSIQQIHIGNYGMPCHDVELAAGFLMPEGVVRDLADIEQIASTAESRADERRQANLGADVARQVR